MTENRLFYILHYIINIVLYMYVRYYELFKHDLVITSI